MSTASTRPFASGSHWSSDEDEYLRTMYGTGLIDVLAERLGRTERAIVQRAFNLRISSAARATKAR